MGLKAVEAFSIKKVDMTKSNWPELVSYSFKTTGFAVLTNHGIDPKLIETAYAQWADFFRSEDKLRYESDGNMGYIRFGQENAKGNPIKDLKEMYHLFYPYEMIPNGINHHVTRDMADAMMSIARHVLFILQKEIPSELFKLQAQPLHSMVRESTNNLLRILHYPALQGVQAEAGAVRAAAHEDINLITVLPAATEPGLEVMDLEGNWHKVECDPGSLILNVGDMLTEASGGVFKSTTHRVVNPERSDVSRYSMPMFVHPRGECRLSQKYTAEEYLNERLREIGLIK